MTWVPHQSHTLKISRLVSSGYLFHMGYGCLHYQTGAHITWVPHKSQCQSLCQKWLGFKWVPSTWVPVSYGYPTMKVSTSHQRHDCLSMAWVQPTHTVLRHMLQKGIVYFCLRIMSAGRARRMTYPRISTNLQLILQRKYLQCIGIKQEHSSLNVVLIKWLLSKFSWLSQL